ncbi:MAG: hypothetical protein Kow001_03710 [Acidobacteriota bacterium]
MSHDRGRRLDGWKEISSYTGIPPRTLQRWERDRGFPARRLPGSPLEPGRAAKVYAFSAEIDAWMDNGAHGYVRPELRLKRRMVGMLVGLGVAIGLGMAGFHLYRTYVNPPEPITATLDRDGLLTARDEAGSVLWTFVVDGGPLRLGFPPRRPLVYLGDWDQDGSNEVIAALAREREEENSQLVCLDAGGSRRWTFQPGGPLRWGGEEISGRFRLQAMRAPGHLRDGRAFFAAVFNYYPLFPSVLVVLDGEGRVVGRYGNTGFIFDLDLIDVDADGQDEIVFGGINNRLNAPVVGLIDPTVQNAISPVPEGYAPGWVSGQERIYRAIPRTPLADAWQTDSRVVRVDVTDNGVICLEVQVRGDPHLPNDVEERVYFLGADLTPFRVELPYPYRLLHQQLYEAGRIREPLDDTLIRRLLQFGDPVVQGAAGHPGPS